MEIEQTKSLRKDYWGLSLDESDLARIASILKKSVIDFEGNIEIVVVSQDGEDTYRSNDPQFFSMKICLKLYLIWL